jgi:hypothetical protein
MKGFSFGRPRTEAVIAAAYFATHLPFLAPSLEDSDSINFALGLREFDPAQHQPHPPGYPLYIALGRLSLAVVSAVWPALPPIAAEAMALAFWSAIGGAMAIMAAAALFSAIHPAADGDRREVVWAVLLLAVAPLFWMSGLRPLSDAIGLGVALAAQAVAARSITDRRWLMGAAFVTGLVGGVRVQAMLLPLPLLLVALAAHRRAGLGGLVSRSMAAAAAGVLCWLVPLVVATGGSAAYLRALDTQAAEDFAWVGMLWVEPTPRRLAFVLYETFVLPWGSGALAAVALTLAAVGLMVAVRRQPRAVALMGLAFGPYLLFHLLFHETIHVRYALPVVPAVVWLGAIGMTIARGAMPVLGAGVVAASLVAVLPASVRYGREPHPAFRAIADAADTAREQRPAAVFAHFEVWRALQANPQGLPVVAPRRQYEWLDAVDRWRRGESGEFWFLADARRTDLDLIDPRSHRVAPYGWSVGDRPELSGVRPSGVDWHRLLNPSWFVGEGWSLTPESGGIAAATNASPGYRPIQGWIRRQQGPMHLMIGGRHLGVGEPAAEFELALDGVVRDRWRVTPEQRNFLRFLDLPEGLIGSGTYAVVTVTARNVGGGAANVAIRQFDARSTDEVLVGFGEGWHEAEFELQTGRRWRWTSERSLLRLKGLPQDVRVTLHGESPLRYFDTPPTVRLTAAGRVVAELQPADDFEWVVTVPADDVQRAGGVLAIESDRVYLPGAAEGTADERHLGLRLWQTRVDPVRP